MLQGCCSRAHLLFLYLVQLFLIPWWRRQLKVGRAVPARELEEGRTVAARGMEGEAREQKNCWRLPPVNRNGSASARTSNGKFFIVRSVVITLKSNYRNIRNQPLQHKKTCTRMTFANIVYLPRIKFSPQHCIMFHAMSIEASSLKHLEPLHATSRTIYCNIKNLMFATFRKK